MRYQSIAMYEYWLKQTMKKSKQEKWDMEISAMIVHLLILRNYDFV